MLEGVPAECTSERRLHRYIEKELNMEGRIYGVCNLDRSGPPGFGGWFDGGKTCPGKPGSLVRVSGVFLEHFFVRFSLVLHGKRDETLFFGILFTQTTFSWTCVFLLVEKGQHCPELERVRSAVLNSFTKVPFLRESAVFLWGSIMFLKNVSRSFSQCCISWTLKKGWIPFNKFKHLVKEPPRKSVVFPVPSKMQHPPLDKHNMPLAAFLEKKRSMIFTRYSIPLSKAAFTCKEKPCKFE